MKYELDEYNRDTPDEELLADLKRVAGTLGSRRVTMDLYEKHGRFHPSTLQRRFGGWFKVLDRAGLERTRNLHVSDEEWFENLAQVWEALGRQPRYDETTKPLSKYCAGAYAHRFSTWRLALKAFVEWANAEELEAPECEASASPTGHITPRQPDLRLRFKVMRRDDFKCCHCGTSPALQTGIVLEVDHKVPWSKGGETLLENLQTLCQACNNGKSNLPLTEAELG